MRFACCAAIHLLAAPRLLPPAAAPPARTLPVAMGLFDGLAGAFTNDDTLGERKDAGMTNKVQRWRLTWRGKKPNPFQDAPVTEGVAIAGQKLRDLAREQNIPIRYSCNEGHCGICDVMIDGRRVPACVAKAPKKDCVIDYAPESAPPRPAPKTKKSAASAPTAAATPAAAPVESDEERIARLQRQLMGEAAANSQQKKKSGWPFG